MIESTLYAKLLVAAPPWLMSAGGLTVAGVMVQNTGGVTASELGPTTKVALGLVVIILGAAIPLTWKVAERVTTFQNDVQRTLRGDPEDPNSPGLISAVNEIAGVLEKVVRVIDGDEDLDAPGLLERVGRAEETARESMRIVTELDRRLGGKTLGDEASAG